MSTMCVMVVSVMVLGWLRFTGAATPVPRNSQAENIKWKNVDIAFPDDLDVRTVPRQNYMSQYHHHHHNPDLLPHHHHHHHHFGDDDNDKFEGETLEVDAPENKSGSNTSLQIPLKFIQEINKHNVSDLLLNFVEGYKEDDDFIIQNRYGDNTVQQRGTAAVMPKSASCIPEMQIVKLATTDDPTIILIPECTRVERCGGCCTHSLYSCQPVEKDSIAFKVIRTQYMGGPKAKYLDKQIVVVEKHTKCKCMCRVRPEDCNKFQEYQESECRCACINHDEEKKCNKNKTKLWDPDVCACQCRETVQCSTGSLFDQNECRCIIPPMKRRFASYQKRSYRFEPLPVVPLNEDD